MDKQIMKHGQECQTLLNHIPAGVMQCMNDKELTLVEVNQEFIDLFGFSKQELKDRFEDSFLNMIHPSDRLDVQAKAASGSEHSHKKVLQYRVLCKDGSYKWMMENAQLICDVNGKELFFSVLIDITEYRNAREELSLSLKLHQIIMDQAADILFVWDFQSDTINYSSNWEKRFGYPPYYEGLHRRDTVFKNIHPEDIPSLSETMIAVKSGTPFSTTDARVRNAEGQYTWCRLRATCQYDEAGEPVKAVGVITDIDNEKRMIEDLKKRAERDALTGLYNREETERLVRRYLEDNPNELCALLMIDTDDFKGVNDRQGHLFGDAVLSELAAGMKKMTRQSDVVGRIGGDEFTILLKNITSREVAVEKTQQLLDLFQHLFERGKSPIQVTCSAGIAVYPYDGNNFHSLYHSADQALYQAKSRGKNQYVLFDRENVLPVEQMGYTALGAAIDSDHQAASVPGELLSYVIQVLYDNQDVDRVVQLILEILGKRFDVSRVYIFENSDDNKYTDNTYEWCNDGIEPQKEKLQHLPYAQIESYDSVFEESTIFYCSDISVLSPVQRALFESQGIHSTLQCAIMDNNRFRGFIGFDECTGMRMWTKEEISTLSLVSQLLTLFLLKKRATERDRQMVSQLNTILDTQHAFIYAIEKDSYQLLYFNDKTCKLEPGVALGMTCYGAFFDRDTPCETCPLQDGTCEIYNSKYDVWTRTDASPMKWGSVDAYLVTCFDITKYKRLLKEDS